MAAVKIYYFYSPFNSYSAVLYWRLYNNFTEKVLFHPISLLGNCDSMGKH